MAKDHVEGLWVAAATPLGADGAVDAGLLAAHGEWLFGQGCDGLVLFGTTGEGTSFSITERLATVEGLLKRGIPADKLSLGTGFPAVPDSIAATKGMLGLGLRHALILPPYFFRDASDEGIQDAFCAIIDGVADERLRAMLYHIPQVSGVGVAPAVLAGLRQRYGVQLAGVKDSTGAFAVFEAFRAAAPDAPAVVGNEPDIGRALGLGGKGTICGMANIVPGLVRAMFAGAGAEGPMKAAVALMQAPFLPTLKAVLAAQTGNPAWARTRAPLRPLDAEAGGRVAAALKALALPRAA